MPIMFHGINDPSYSNIVVGTYTGNADRNSTTTQSIVLGFQPRYVQVSKIAEHNGTALYEDPHFTACYEFYTPDYEHLYGDLNEIYGACTYLGYPLKRMAGIFTTFDTEKQDYEIVNILEITETGFNVANARYEISGSGGDYGGNATADNYILNLDNTVYTYLAIK